MYAKLRNFYWHGGGKVKRKKDLETRKIYCRQSISSWYEISEPKVSGWKIWACYRAVRIFGRWAASAKE